MTVTARRDYLACHLKRLKLSDQLHKLTHFE